MNAKARLPVALVAMILIVTIPALAYGLGQTETSVRQLGETATTVVLPPSNVTTTSLETTPVASATPTPAVTAGRGHGRPTQHPPKGVRPVAKAAIVRSRYHAHGVVTASSYGQGHDAQGMARGGRTTDKVTIRVNGKKKKAYVAIIACKSFPIGTVLAVRYRGVTGYYAIQDRGPYISGRTLDIGPRGQKDLRFGGVHKVHYQVIGRLKHGYNWRKFPGTVTKYTFKAKKKHKK